MSDTQKAPDPYPPKVMEELRTLLLRVQALMSAERLWARLTPQDRRRLGGDFAEAYSQGKTVGMWMRLRGVSQPRAIIETAREVGLTDEATRNWLMREIGELDSTSEETIAAAVESGALVLVEQGRHAYWNGEKISVNWYKQSALWEFLWVLCDRAKSGTGLDCMDFAEKGNSDYPSKTKHRLCGLDAFPHDLGILINSEGQGIQKLDLPPSRIRLFKVETVEILREVTG